VSAAVLISVILSATVPAGAKDPAGAVTATATASKAEVTVGEVFEVDVAARGPEGTAWTFPVDAGDEQVELRTLSSPASSPPPAGTQHYAAAVFAIGEAQVPPIQVKYRLPDGTAGTVATAPLTVRILSVLPKDPKEQKLVDIRPPVDVTIGRAFWILVGVLALLLAAAVWALLRRRRRAVAPKPVVPATPPDVAALQALDQLAASGLLHGGEYRAFYIGLAAIAKRYLEQRLGAPILEMTSSESVAYLRGHAHGAELAPLLRDLATAADRIKFARGQGLREEGERHLLAVRGMITTLEERLRPRPAADAAKVA
jgi:hypothetical protein